MVDGDGFEKKKKKKKRNNGPQLARGGFIGAFIHATRPLSLIRNILARKGGNKRDLAI